MSRRLLAVAAAAAALAIPAAPAQVRAAAPSNATTLAAPSVILIRFTVSAYVQDNRNGNTYGSRGESSPTPFTDTTYGTGFFVSSNGGVATTAHVGAPGDQSITTTIVDNYIDQQAVETGNCRQSDALCLLEVEQQYFSAYLQSSTVTRLQTAVTVFTQNMTSADEGLPATVEASVPAATGTDTAILKVGLQNTPVLALADSSSVRSGDDVSVIGYPSVSGVSTGLSTTLHPAVTSATISAVATAPPGFATIGTVFQTDATYGPADSGAPAVDTEGGVVGLVSFGGGGTKAAYVVPSNAIRETLRHTELLNSLGPIDHLWSDGLSLFGESHYRAAESDFHQCAGLNAAQVGCAVYDAKAKANFPGDVPLVPSAPSGGGAGVAAGIPIALLVCCVAGVGVLLRRRRRTLR